MAGAYKYRPQYTQNTIGPSPGPPIPSSNMTPEQLLRDAENELEKARAENGNSPAIENILDALGLMLNAQLQILDLVRKNEHG